MNEKLHKAYEILKEEQRNADNKAYIFILLLGGILGYLATEPIPNNAVDITGFTIFILLLATPVLLLLYTLVPRYKVNEANDSRDYGLSLNIFFWKSIVKYKSIKVFEKEYLKKYKDVSIDQYGLDMLEQIFKNSKIMHRKATVHRIALMFMMSLLYIFTISMLYMIYPSINEVFLVIITLGGLIIIPLIFRYTSEGNKVDESSESIETIYHFINKNSSMKIDEHRLYAKRIFKYLSQNNHDMISYTTLAELNDIDYKYKHKDAPNQFIINISITLGIIGTVLNDLGLPYIQSLVVKKGTKVNGPGYYESFSRGLDKNEYSKEQITKKEVESVKKFNWSDWEKQVLCSIDKVQFKMV